MLRRTALVGLLAAALTGVGAVQLLPGAAPAARADALTGFGGCDDLLRHYRAELGRSVTAYGFGWGGGGYAVDLEASSGGEAAARQSADAGAVGSGPTGTNLQEQGVDEPDLAKLRDGRLLVLTGNRLRVVSAEAQPRLLGSLRVGGRDTYGGELLLVGDRALVVVPGWRQDGGGPDTGATDRLARFAPGTPITEVMLLDVSGDTPRLLERSTYGGQYVSARLVDDTVRLVTTTRPQLRAVYPMREGPGAEHAALVANRLAAANAGLEQVLPQLVREDADGTVLEKGAAVGCDHTYYSDGATGASTLLVSTLQPADGLEPTDRTAVTTDGDLVYASQDRLYVATGRWGTVAPLADGRGIGTDVPDGDEVSTELHAFDTTSGDQTRYVGSGSVPGYVLGRWALSEHEGALRVATTRQPPWQGEKTGATSSMVVKLTERNGSLVETGRVGGLGRTEQIRAVRYFGDIAAVVTFRQTDPLYLLDLSGTPRLLGELKVPGFSTYLHPLGDGLLLGIGQDATAEGQVTGMQVSVFDVSDLSSPRVRDRLRLGAGWSPALEDSRAFGYDPQRRLATFGFTGYEDKAFSEGMEQSTAVGVSVADDGSLSVAGELDLASGTWPQRVLNDGDLVYAVTDNGVVAGDAGTMRRTGALTFTTG